MLNLTQCECDNIDCLLCSCKKHLFENLIKQLNNLNFSLELNKNIFIITN